MPVRGGVTCTEVFTYTAAVTSMYYLVGVGGAESENGGIRHPTVHPFVLLAVSVGIGMIRPLTPHAIFLPLDQKHRHRSHRVFSPIRARPTFGALDTAYGLGHEGCVGEADALGCSEAATGGQRRRGRRRECKRSWFWFFMTGGGELLIFAGCSFSVPMVCCCCCCCVQYNRCFSTTGQLKLKI